MKSLSGLSGSDPALFVFHWYAYDFDNTLLRDDVVTLSFTGAGEKRVTIENIPDGAHVVVHEEDNRTYTLTGENDKELTVSAEEVRGVSFSNRPNDNPGGGFGVGNHFTYLENDDGTGNEWLWEPTPDAA